MARAMKRRGVSRSFPRHAVEASRCAPHRLAPWKRSIRRYPQGLCGGCFDARAGQENEGAQKSNQRPLGSPGPGSTLRRLSIAPYLNSLLLSSVLSARGCFLRSVKRDLVGGNKRGQGMAISCKYEKLQCKQIYRFGFKRQSCGKYAPGCLGLAVYCVLWLLGKPSMKPDRLFGSPSLFQWKAKINPNKYPRSSYNDIMFSDLYSFFLI
jgi:hypothetical protein